MKLINIILMASILMLVIAGSGMAAKTGPIEMRTGAGINFDGGNITSLNNITFDASGDPIDVNGRTISDVGAPSSGADVYRLQDSWGKFNDSGENLLYNVLNKSSTTYTNETAINSTVVANKQSGYVNETAINLTLTGKLDDDGENLFTNVVNKTMNSNLAAGGYKITGVGNGTSGQDVVTYSQLQSREPVLADDYPTVEAAIDVAMNTSGIVQFYAGNYTISRIGKRPDNYNGWYNKGFTLRGVGNSTILRLADHAVSGACVIFNLGVPAAPDDTTLRYTFQDLVIDGNGDNQNFSSTTAGDGHNAIGGLAGGLHAYDTLTVENVVLKNFTMNATKPSGWTSSGSGINTHGAKHVFVTNVNSDNCDVGIWATRSYSGADQDSLITNFVAKNSYVAGVEIETSSNFTLDNFYIYNDANFAINNSTGISILDVVPYPEFDHVIITNGQFWNLGCPVYTSGNYQLDNSIFSNLIATNCSGSFRLYLGNNTIIDNIISDNSAWGDIVGVDIRGAIEIGPEYNLAPLDTKQISNIYVNNSHAYAIAYGRNVSILGGHIANSASGISIGMAGADVGSRAYFKDVLGISYDSYSLVNGRFGNYNLNSASWTNIDATNLTIEVDSLGSMYMVEFSMFVYSNSGSSIFIDVTDDGTSIGASAYGISEFRPYAAACAGTLVGFQSHYLPPGHHHLTLVGATSDGGLITIYSGVGMHSVRLCATDMGNNIN